MQQRQRDAVMNRVRSGKTDLLMATDVAARGLDIEHVSHVVNFDVPTEPDGYIHRIGRTGRAGREGVAITFVEPREQRLLRNIQQATQQKIPIENIPTVADLRNRRLELTRASLRETLVAGELDVYRQLVTELASEHDAMDVAAAAVKLAHLSSHQEGDEKGEEQDLPLVSAPAERHAPRDERFERKAKKRGPRAHGFEVARLFIGAGRLDSLRPGDLVGAIANEAGIDGEAIGAIKIADRFALVEVPEEFAEIVIQALRNTQIRGRRVTVRRDLMS
jgi:ATP-dependent RNA helicase DeaD